MASPHRGRIRGGRRGGRPGWRQWTCYPAAMALTPEILALFVHPSELDDIPTERVKAALRRAEQRFDVATREGEARACVYAGELLRQARGRAVRAGGAT